MEPAGGPGPAGGTGASGGAEPAGRVDAAAGAGASSGAEPAGRARAHSAAGADPLGGAGASAQVSASADVAKLGAVSVATAPGTFSFPRRQRTGSATSAGSQGMALSRMARRTAAAEGASPRWSCRLMSSAATPVTMGAAQLVPLRRQMPPPGRAPSMFSPGASTPCSCRTPPWLLKSSGRPSSPIAPTASTPGWDEGAAKNLP
ncbi:hypothetical protein WMF15_28675 [Sorangium sp. So ce233]